MRHTDRVVMRVRPLVQLVTVPLLGVFVVGIAWGLGDALVHGDPGRPFATDGFGPVGITVGWCIAVIMFLASLFGVLPLLRLRVVITPDGFDARAYFRHYRLTLDQVTAIVALSGSAVSTPQPKFPGFRVVARDAAGRRRGFQLSSVYTGTARATPILAAWVSRRPELVRDEATRAVFLAHGVDVPRAPAARHDELRAATPVSHRFTLTDGATTREVDSPGI